MKYEERNDFAELESELRNLRQENEDLTSRACVDASFIYRWREKACSLEEELNKFKLRCALIEKRLEEYDFRWDTLFSELCGVTGQRDHMRKRAEQAESERDELRVRVANLERQIKQMGKV